tara:strand:+ start:14586 stop:15794 length:1209 start_codon:yes stop_codon:yes gene_type:complete
VKLREVNGRDNFERFYILLVASIRHSSEIIFPYLRRFQRFIFLPYCYLFLVNWKNCPKEKFKVAFDFLYIFFVLRTFPDFYYPYRLWEKSRNEWKYYYGSNYDCHQRSRLRKDVQKAEYEILYEDKAVCWRLCAERKIAIPKTFGVLDPTSEKGKVLTYLSSFIVPGEKLIAKPIGGKGGHLIIVLTKNDSGELQLLRPEKKILDADNIEEIFKQKYLIQKFVNQHEDLNRISDSVNTIRFVTLLRKDNKVVPVGAYIRLGAQGAFIDNLSQGGMAVAVDLVSGKLGPVASDRYGTEFSRHPDSEVVFGGFPVPKWEQVVEIANKVQSALPFHKLLGMDIAITQDGPVIVEVNSIYDNVDLESVCGPLLKNRDILLAFGEYQLLFNRYQKKLYKEALRSDQK